MRETGENANREGQDASKASANTKGKQQGQKGKNR